MIEKRAKLLNSCEVRIENKKIDNKAGKVIYWMSREQRVHDNHALLFAKSLADKYGFEFGICFSLAENFLGATARHFGFMLRGLNELIGELAKFNIPFFLLRGNPSEEILKFTYQNDSRILVTDFDPLKIKRKWKEEVNSKINIPLYEVDAHNVVPYFLASDKEEFAAYTIRPKIKKNLAEFLIEYPKLEKHDNSKEFVELGTKEIEIDLSKYDNTPGEVNSFSPGEISAKKMLNNFINNRLENYATDRNDPVKNALSHLSPYYHFGQLSPLRVALAVNNSGASSESKNAYLEELIIRRELSDNYCYYNKNYDNIHGIRNWARDTLEAHKNDRRDYLYDLEHFEQAATHDKYWNAAQIEMVKTGKMHGYMRMYWAKKILEWSKSPEEAFEIAIYLNDKYELDGRDPNGYVGVAWSIGGIHDRAWTERPVYGKIRYMNSNGLRRKFKADEYAAKYIIEKNKIF